MEENQITEILGAQSKTLNRIEGMLSELMKERKKIPEMSTGTVPHNEEFSAIMNAVDISMESGRPFELAGYSCFEVELAVRKSGHFVRYLGKERVKGVDHSMSREWTLELL